MLNRRAETSVALIERHRSSPGPEPSDAAIVHVRWSSARPRSCCAREIEFDGPRMPRRKIALAPVPRNGSCDRADRPVVVHASQDVPEIAQSSVARGRRSASLPRTVGRSRALCWRPETADPRRAPRIRHSGGIGGKRRREHASAERSSAAVSSEQLCKRKRQQILARRSRRPRARRWSRLIGCN